MRACVPGKAWTDLMCRGLLVRLCQPAVAEGFLLLPLGASAARRVPSAFSLARGASGPHSSTRQGSGALATVSGWFSAVAGRRLEVGGCDSPGPGLWQARLDPADSVCGKAETSLVC